MDLEGLDIIIEDGKVNGNNRQVHGTVKINGDMYDWNLEGDDDETCIFINKEENLTWITEVLLRQVYSVMRIWICMILVRRMD